MKIFSRLLTLAGAIYFCSACSSGSAENGKSSGEGRVLPVVELTGIDTVLYTAYVADIQAVNNVEVRSRLQGFLDHINVDEGASVKKGQILFKINPDEYQADVSKAQATLNNAIADSKTVAVELERVKRLVDKNIISQTDLEVAQAQLNAAEARVQESRSNLQHAQTRLSYSDVRSPFNGRIDRIPLKVGSLLTEGSLLTSVSDLHEVFAYFDVSEAEYLRIITAQKSGNSILGKEVRLVLANGQDYPYTGKVELAESEFEVTTGTISLRARFNNPEGLLKHSSSGKILLPTDIENSLIVPQKAVSEIQDRTYVYVLDSADRVKMTSFKAGPRLGHFYLVNGGLKSGDRIIYEGTQTLKDKSKVRTREVNLDSLIRNSDVEI